MSSLQIRQDQENLKPDFRQKQAGGQLAKAMATQQPKMRSALGVLDHNKQLKEPTKGKQPFRDAKGQNVQRGVQEVAKENFERTSVPVVPVAQFEAFKVYEDDETLPEKFDVAERKAVEVEMCSMEHEEQYKSDVLQPPIEESPRTPMSLGDQELNDSLEENNIAITFRHKSEKDVFFEMEEYRDDIYAYLREHELRNRPKPGYILKQPDVTDNMRCILVDWLVEVAQEYDMHTETLYLAINYIDRFLSYMAVVRAKLQLVGTAAMYIAAKYEEIMPPDVGEFVYITDDTYDKKQVIRMEHLILRVLHFDISIPTPLTFITLISTFTQTEEKIQYLAMYLCELTLLDVSLYLQFLPSTLASSALALARHTLHKEAWPEAYQNCTSYPLVHLQQCIGFLYQCFVKAPTHPQRAIPDKYKSGKYYQVSKIIPRNEMIMFE